MCPKLSEASDNNLRPLSGLLNLLGFLLPPFLFILKQIGNKTLQDTVLPREHWTLKQASRAGCSCCGPDPYDQEGDDDVEDSNVKSISPDRVTTNAALDMAVPGAFATAIRGTGGSSPFAVKSPVPPPASTGYVDGTQGFAFDPTRFST